MDPIRKFWDAKLDILADKLTENGFTAHIADRGLDVSDIILNKIAREVKAKTISFGGSKSVVDTGVYEGAKALKGVKVLDTYDLSASLEERVELRRQALLSDLFITGTNALTEDGQLVNLDGMGNRVSALSFGPKNVAVIIGRNKVCLDIDQAMGRIKEYAAPVNAMRLKRKTPCAKTGYCADCKSPDRICNAWSIIEKSAPKGRIHAILVNEDLGF